MIWDIDDLLDMLEKAIASSLGEIEEGRVVKTEKVSGNDIVKITASLSIGPAIPTGTRVEAPGREPLVDVFDDEKGLRIVVELPGVKKDDVRVDFLDGVLRVVIIKDGKVHQKDVPCEIAPGSVEVKSTRENNSVVEITFIRRMRKEDAREREQQ